MSRFCTKAYPNSLVPSRIDNICYIRAVQVIVGKMIASSQIWAMGDIFSEGNSTFIRWANLFGKEWDEDFPISLHI